MPRIKNLEKDLTIHGNDKLLGSDGQDGSTKNYLVSDLANFIVAEGGSFKHHQNNASDTWTITHNLNLDDYLPHVNIKLSGGGTFDNVQAMGVVTFIDKNTLRINLADPASGYAYIKK